MTFIESPGFTQRVSRILDDAALSDLQRLLMADPQRGRVMVGCGGLRKIRVGDPRRKKGKRGGCRVVYLHVPETSWVYLLDIYGKDVKDDLSANERAVLKRLGNEYKEAALRAAKGARRG
jgi:hypothetical protein